MNRVLELAILGLLMDRDHHGYEVRASLRDRLGVATNVSFGSIYPALARLERSGLVVALTQESPTSPLASSISTGSLSGERATLRARRPAGALGRKSRKVYRITPAGREEFTRLLGDPATMDDSRNFSLRVALARYLTPHLRIGLLEHQRAALAARLREVRHHADNEQLDDYARSVMLHAAKGVELDLEWIDNLLTTERHNQELASEAT